MWSSNMSKSLQTTSNCMEKVETWSCTLTFINYRTMLCTWLQYLIAPVQCCKMSSSCGWRLWLVSEQIYICMTRWSPDEGTRCRGMSICARCYVISTIFMKFRKIQWAHARRKTGGWRVCLRFTTPHLTDNCIVTKIKTKLFLVKRWHFGETRVCFLSLFGHTVYFSEESLEAFWNLPPLM